MSVLQQLIVDPSSSYNLGSMRKIREILQENPEQLLDLEAEAVSKLLREALLYQSSRELGTEIINIIAKHRASVDPLKLALLQGNIKSLETLLKDGLRFDGAEWDVRALFKYVFENENVGVRKNLLKLLLKYGCLDTGYRSTHGENLIHVYVNNHVKRDDFSAVEIVEILINSGISVKQMDNSRRTLLHNSVTRENIELIKFFLNNGVDVNRKTKSRKSALHMATDLDCSAEIVNLLLSRGAKVDARDGRGRTPLYYACHHHSEKSIVLLVRKGASISAQDMSRKSAFSQLRPGHWKKNYEDCLIALVKEISVLHFENSKVSKKDLDVIHASPNVLTHFKMCLDELRDMSSTKFHPAYSYYKVLKMSNKIKKLAPLTKNEEIVTKFPTYLHRFFYYGTDLRRIFDDAEDVRDNLNVVVAELHSAFGNYFPDVVIKKLSDCLASEMAQ